MARVLDLRAEFEAQLRAVVRVEEQLRQAEGATDERGRRLQKVLRRELTEMLANNASIRSVLDDLASDVGRSPANP